MTHDISGGARLKQIIGILQKHNILSGITPEKLCAIIEELGPTFVKLGQIMSMRPDMIPLPYAQALQKLRTAATPMPPEEVRRVVESSLQTPLEKAFPTFDFTPLGSASIAQAHRATLPGGNRVVVKVQREGIHEKMKSDIALLQKAAKLLKYTPTGETVDLHMVLEEMWVVSQEEMNFITEARNMEEFHRLNADVAYVSCPKVYREQCTAQLLVMEEIIGLRIDDVPRLKSEGYNPEEIAKKLCANYTKQILDDGFFHADPHPGNLFVRDGRIVWIDLGMVGHLSAKDQASFRKAAVAAVSKDTGGMMEAILHLGKCSQPVNRETMYADVDGMLAQYMEMSITDINVGQIAQQVMELAKKHHISMPPGVTMLSRGVMTIEGVLADVCPSVSLMDLLSQRFASDSFRRKDWKKTALLSLKTISESVQKSLSIPALLTDTLRAAQKGELKIRIEQTCAPEQEKAHERREKQKQNTCVLCTGIAASALMCLSDITPTMLGVPWIAMAGFVATGVFALVQRLKKK